MFEQGEVALRDQVLQAKVIDLPDRVGH
jgi:hypothetical protein